MSLVIISGEILKPLVGHLRGEQLFLIKNFKAFVWTSKRDTRRRFEHLTSLLLHQSGQGFAKGSAPAQNGLLFASLSSENLKRPLWHIQFSGQKCYDGLIGCTINRWSRDPAFEPGRITKLTNNLVFGGPRLNKKVQQHCPALNHLNLFRSYFHAVKHFFLL